MGEVKPIETIYQGYRFRSRLEARWAVFFDMLRIPWDYEREGYDLGGMWYLPDFWLPQQDCWVEIKAENPGDEEREKARRLALYTQKDVFILYGTVGPFSVTMQSIDDKPGESIYNGALGHAFMFRKQMQDVYFHDTFYRFGECSQCHTIVIAFHGQGYGNRSEDEIEAPWSLSTKNCCHCNIGTVDDSPRLITAYAAARAARFEYGETPQPPEESSEELLLAKAMSEATITPADFSSSAGRNMEAVTSADRLYFELHPDKAKLTRPFYEEEVPPEVLAQWKTKFGRYPYQVEVQKTVTPGIRSRTFLLSEDGKYTCGMVMDADTREAMQALKKDTYRLKAYGQHVMNKHKAKQARKQADRQRKRNRKK